MTYYKVKPEYDNFPRYVTLKRSGNSVIDSTLIANELYTEHEMKSIENSYVCFEVVQYSKMDTVRMFGARFYKGDLPK